MPSIFQYTKKEIEHLKRVDKRLAAIIDQVGMIERQTISDLFTALIHSIIGQQISTKAHTTIWNRMQKELGNINPVVIDSMSLEELQRFGITFKKAGYMKSAARKIIIGEFDMESLHTLSDEEVCHRLCELDGVGVWTAEMLMLFSMQRPNILSYGDLAILRGMRMVYHHRQIDKETFNRHWKRYAPYASVASLYLWAAAGGAIEGMKDYEPKKKQI